MSTDKNEKTSRFSSAIYLAALLALAALLYFGRRSYEQHSEEITSGVFDKPQPAEESTSTNHSIAFDPENLDRTQLLAEARYFEEKFLAHRHAKRSGETLTVKAYLSGTIFDPPSARLFEQALVYYRQFQAAMQRLVPPDHLIEYHRTLLETLKAQQTLLEQVLREREARDFEQRVHSRFKEWNEDWLRCIALERSREQKSLDARRRYYALKETLAQVRTPLTLLKEDEVDWTSLQSYLEEQYRYQLPDRRTLATAIADLNEKAIRKKVQLNELYLRRDPNASGAGKTVLQWKFELTIPGKTPQELQAEWLVDRSRRALMPHNETAHRLNGLEQEW